MANKGRSSEKLRYIVGTERHRVAMDQLWDSLNTGALTQIEPIDGQGEDLRQTDASGQVITDLQTMYKCAEAAHNQLTPLLQRICNQYFGGRVYVPNSEAEPESGVYLTGAKGAEAVMQKAVREYASRVPGPHFAWVHDVVRQLIVCDSDEQAAEIVQILRDELEVVKLKNRFLKPTMTGFMDILMYVRVNGFICELQIQLLPLFLHEQDNYFHERYEMFKEYLRGPEDVVLKRLDLISYLGKFDEFDGHGSEYTKPVHLDPIVEDFLRESEENTTERVEAMEDLCEYLGELPAALKLQERLVEMFRSNGVEVDIAAALNNLGMLLQVQQRFEEAHQCFEEALEIRRRVLGDDPAVDDSVHNLGLVLRAQGKLDEALPLYRELLELKSKRLGDDHRETDSARANLAAVLQSLGQLEEAEQLGRKSLEDRRKALGNNHPEVGKALNNLAVCLRAQRKFEEAESLFREALNTARQALGPVHPVVAGALTNLATVLEDQRKHAEAEPLYKHALQAFMQTLGPNHPETVSTAENLGHCLEQQSKLDGAEEVYRLALNIKRDALGDSHPETIKTRNLLVSVLRAVGKHEEADVLDPESKPAPTVSSNIPFARDTAAAAAPANTEQSTQPAAPKAEAPEPQQATTQKKSKDESAKQQPDREEKREQEKKPEKRQEQPKQPEQPEQQQLQAKPASDLSTPIYLSILFALLVAVIAWVIA